MAGGSAIGYCVSGRYHCDRVAIVLQRNGRSRLAIRRTVFVLSGKFHRPDVARTLRILVCARVPMDVSRYCRAAHVALRRHVRLPLVGLSGSSLHRIRAGDSHDAGRVLGNSHGPAPLGSVAGHRRSIRRARARRNSHQQLPLHGKLARVALCSGRRSKGAT